MSPLAGAVVLLWIVVILLAFAMAGLRQQVRALQARPVPRQPPASAGPDPVTALAPVLPRPGRLSAILVADEACPSCEEAVPAFAAAAGALPDGVVPVVLTRTELPESRRAGAVRFVADRTAHHALHPGWLPALAVVDSEGKTLLVEPVGSPAAVHAVLASPLLRVPA